MLHVVTLAPELERALLAAHAGQELRPGAAAEGDPPWIEELAAILGRSAQQDCRPAVLASEEVRPLVKRSTERRMPDLACLATSEVTGARSVRRLAEVSRLARPAGTRSAEGMRYSPYAGANSQEALAEMMRQYGPDACIQSHRTVRVGGVLGLFARPAVEITGYVDGKQPDAGAPTAEDASRARSPARRTRSRHPVSAACSARSPRCGNG